MQSLIFFCRVAFICNLCYLFSFVMRYYPVLKDGQVASTIVVLGLVVSGILNIILSLTIIISLLVRKSLWYKLPHWLIIVNFLFLILQLIMFFR